MPDNAGFNRQLNRQQPALRLLRNGGSDLDLFLNARPPAHAIKREVME